MKTRSFNGKEYTVVHTKADYYQTAFHELGFWDRVKVLFGYRIGFTINIRTDNEGKLDQITVTARKKW